MYNGHKKDKADRHRAYVEQVLESISGVQVSKPAVAINTSISGVGAEQDDEIPDDMLRVQDKVKEGCVAVVRGRSAHIDSIFAVPWVSCR